MNLRLYTISQLLKHHEVYISIDTDKIAFTRNLNLYCAVIKKTTYASGGREIVDLRIIKHTHIDYIIAISERSKKIWLIPIDDIAENSTLQLNGKKDNYLLEAPSIDKDEIDLAHKITTIHTSNQLVEQEQKDAIQDLLATEGDKMR